MSNKNFGEPWEGKIERIRENLREGRYSLQDGIFPIVKELVQNAEDAGAPRLLVAWHGGLANAGHPLLRGPGLVAINDGIFDAGNGRAIREMGLSSKAADASSIGKFGLGMKSVFHLGEVFFFVAVDAQGRRVDADVRSPWSADEGGLHQEWDDFSEGDIEELSNCVRAMFGEGQRFCLWLPLRTREQCGDVDPIEPFWAGEMEPEHLFGSSLLERLPTILPLLTRTTAMEIRTARGEGSTAHHATLDSSSIRREDLTRFDSVAPGTRASFGGSVTLQDIGLANSLTYAGSEYRTNDSELESLQKDESKKWPRRFATDHTTGKSEQKPEKALQHSAACFTATACGRPVGKLRIQWAVFLPFGVDEEADLSDVPWDVDLILHGWFFPNSGRTAVEGLADESPSLEAVNDSSTVRRAWNHRLAAYGTLPLVPRALADIACRCSWDHLVSLELTGRLQKSELFRRFGTSICREQSWVRRLSTDGHWRWQVIPSDSHFYELPSTGAKAIVGECFPTLSAVAGRMVVVFHDEPRLVASEPQRWPSDVVAELIDAIDPATLFSTREYLEYFIRFMDASAETGSWTKHANQLVALTRAALKAVLGVVPETVSNAARQFIRRIPCQSRIRLRTEINDQSTGADLFGLLCENTDSVVWIPEALEPIDSAESTGQIPASESMMILRQLSTWAERKLTATEADRLGEVAAQVICATSDLAILLEEAGDLRLFSGSNCRERREVRLTWKDIVDHHRRHLLFKKPSPMARWLQEAILDDSILLVSTNLVRAIYGDQPNAPSQCREGQLLAALATDVKPRLTEPVRRRRLFESLLNYADGRSEPHYRDCIRYVLHGDPNHFTSSESLLVQGHSGTDVWWRMAGFAMESLKQEWRIVDPSFSDFTKETRQTLDLQVVDADVAISLAAQVPPQCFATLRPSEAEYRDLLRQITDDNLCRSLPIHQDSDGEFVSIGDNTYWESDRSLPAGLEHDTRVLKRSQDDSTWRRQQTLADSITAEVVMGITLRQTNPGESWNTIMDCLCDTSHPSAVTVSLLRRTKWVPAADGRFIDPNDVIHLPELQDEVARLVSDYPGSFADPASLAPTLQSHPAFEQFLRDIVPGQDDALDILGELLAEDCGNFVGNTDVSFDEWLEAFRTDDGTLFPRVPLLRTARDRLPTAAHRTFERLKRPITDDRARQLLDYLRIAHQKERSGTRRSKVARVFGQYMRSILTASNFVDQVRGLTLPAMDGTWRPAAELCYGNDGIDPSAVVDSVIEPCLVGLFSVPGSTPDTPESSTPPVAGFPRQNNWAAVSQEIACTADRLRTYFRPWRDLIPDAQIGAFLALLGDDSGVRELAQEYLGRNRTLEVTRGKVPVPVLCKGHYITDCVIVDLAEAPTVPVFNLLNEEILAPRATNASTLLVGYGRQADHFPRWVVNQHRVCCFRLNVIDPRQFIDRLGYMLRNTAVKFLRAAYGPFDEQAFDLTWQEFGESDQLDIRIAQSLILDSTFEKLISYGLRSNRKLGPILDHWRTAKKQEAERASARDTSVRQIRTQSLGSIAEATSKLRALLDSDKEVQIAVLGAVRRQISDRYQYELESIPFELFQNADDAYDELFQYFEQSPDEATGRDGPSFTVALRSDTFVCVHFGRRINQFPTKNVKGTLGFDDDLWKMCCLHLSDKGYVDRTTCRPTGKFGLGFKSVFLACDQPRILSGRLVFEFVGGIYPRPLIDDERRTLDDLRASVAGGDTKATIIELPLREGMRREQLTARFERLAHILVVFARRIRRCVWDVVGKETNWLPDEVPGVPGCFSGDISTLTSPNGCNSTRRVLLFQSESGSLLLAIGSRRVESFEDDIPTVWVTAPTERKLAIGFLVNGDFAVDVGRAQLAGDPVQNLEMARQLGRRFLDQLTGLFNAFESPDTGNAVRQSMRLAADADPFEFWDSLWDRLALAVNEKATSDDPAERLIRDILWSHPDCGVASFIANHAAIPVRLPGSRFARKLVKLGQIKFSVRGTLTQDDGYGLACVTVWPEFEKRLAGGSLVSHHGVIRPLARLCEPLVQHIAPIELADALHWELTSTSITPETAERLGELVTLDFLQKVNDLSERARIREVLNKAEFLCADGKYHAATDLLVGHEARGDSTDRRDDERRRAQFAPKERVLHDRYGRTGVAFFHACRETLVARSQDMASWVRSAADFETRKAALEYLADGDQGCPIQTELLRHGLAGCWLADVSTEPAFQNLTTVQQYQLAALLGLPPLPPPVRPSPPTASAGEVLRAIHDWWTREHPSQLRRYEQRVYPNRGLPHLADDYDHLSARKDWMTLFLVALMHTMGRTFAEQHRDFIALCDTKGWLGTFAQSERDAQSWIAVIEEYWKDKLDDSKHLQWMKQFVCIYPVSQCLDGYIEVFLSVNRRDFQRPFSLTELTNTRASSKFQRGGVSAPPLSRMMGMGQCFVLRELVRKHLIKSKHAHEHCFVPVARVRRLLVALGCYELLDKQRPWEWSRTIYRFLVRHLGGEAATFLGDFDIPLQIVAEDAQLKDNLFSLAATLDEASAEHCVDEDDAISFEDE